MKVVSIGASPRTLSTHTTLGRALAGCWNGIICTIDLNSATLIDRVMVPGIQVASFAIDESRGQSFAYDEDNGCSVALLDVTAGRVRAVTDLGQSTRSLVIDRRTGCALVAHSLQDADGYLSVLEGHTGKVLASLALDLIITSMVVEEHFGIVFAAVPIEAAIYMLAVDYNATPSIVVQKRQELDGVSALLVAGRLGLILAQGSGPLSPISVFDRYGNIVKTLDREAITPKDRVLLAFRMEIVDRVDNNLFITYLAEHPGLERAGSGIVVYSLKEQRVEWHVATSYYPGGLAVDAIGSRIYILDSNLDARGNSIGVPKGVGRISMFHGTTGELIRTVEVGRGPSAIVVDSTSQQVCVANRLDDTISMFSGSTGY